MQTYESDANIGNIKILAADMDKTLLTDERVLPQGLDERLDKLADAGIVFCPASGRPAPKLEEMFEGIKNRLAFCPDNGACVIYRGSYIYKSNIDVELYQQVLNRASEDPRAVPVLCCFDEFYVLARDHQYHDEISVYYNTINYVDSFEGIDFESNKISVFFPGYDAEPAFRETYSPEFSDKLYVTNAGREWIDFMNLGVDKGAGVRTCANTWASISPTPPPWAIRTTTSHAGARRSQLYRGQCRGAHERACQMAHSEQQRRGRTDAHRRHLGGSLTWLAMPGRASRLIFARSGSWASLEEHI